MLLPLSLLNRDIVLVHSWYRRLLLLRNNRLTLEEWVNLLEMAGLFRILRATSPRILLLIKHLLKLVQDALLLITQLSTGGHNIVRICSLLKPGWRQRFELLVFRVGSLG